MTLSIHQPDYFPYMGYFVKIAQADIFVFFDDAQFSNNNMHHWNKIKTSQGELRIKIPVDYKFGEKINQVRTKDELEWKKKHLKTIKMNYARSKYYKDIFPHFQELMLSTYSNLAEMNIAIISYICEKFSLNPKFIKTSELNINTVREQKVIDICKLLHGDIYFSGNGARVYQDEKHFSDSGIKLCYSSFIPFEYPQLWNEFLPNLSILDYIFNCGFDWELIDKALNN